MNVNLFKTESPAPSAPAPAGAPAGTEQKPTNATQGGDTKPSAASGDGKPTEGAAAAADPAKPEETKPDEKAPSPKDDPKFAAKFAALARREKSLTTREQGIKDREAKLQEFEADQKLRAEDPYAWAEKHGLTYAGWTERVLKGKPSDTDKRLKHLEEEREKERQEALEREKQAEIKKYEDSVNTFKSNLKEYVAKNAETFELIHSQEAYDVVMAVIEEHFEQTEKELGEGKGRLLSVQEACEAVEKHLEEEKAKEVEKLLASKKLKARLKLPDAAPAADPKAGKTDAEPAKPQAAAKPGVTTLSNAMESDLPPQDSRPKTVEESRAAAAKLLRWIPAGPS